MMDRRGFLAVGAAAMAGLGAGLAQRARGDELRTPSPGQLALDDAQSAHLRHIFNLAAMPDGEWRHMGSIDPGQEWLDAYRYQLAFMAYTLGLAAYHHLPAATETLRGPFDALIGKMLRREVWAYWRATSQSGPRLDPGLAALREPWTDPVVRENIMYSGHLLAMVAMYRMLFGDTKYDTAGSLTFRYDPIFYGKGPETYAYDHGALQRRIVEQFAEFHDLGVPCEPNNIFVVCNQYPLLAVRFRDAVDGTAHLDPLLASYRRAWDVRGGVIDGRDSVIWSLMVRQQHLIDYPTPDNAWTLGALNCWMPDRVRAVSGRYAKLWLKETAEGTLQVRPPHELHAMATGTPVGPAMPYRSPALGYAALWLSEVGDRERLTALLDHADRFMQPTTEHGGLFYPRVDRSTDAAGRMTYMDPLTGNALLAYARINVVDGMRAMYERPWTARPSGPSIVTVTGATLRRAVHRDGGQAIEFDLVADAASAAPIVVGFGALTPGRTWQLMETGRSGRPSDGRTVRIPVDARGQATIASAIGAQRYRLEAIG